MHACLCLCTPGTKPQGTCGHQRRSVSVASASPPLGSLGRAAFTRRHKVSFRGSWTAEERDRESRRGRKGEGREAPACPAGLLPPQFPAVVRCRPAAPAGLELGEQLDRVQPLGTWGPARVTALERAPRAGQPRVEREGVLEPGPVPTAAFLPPRESPAPPPLGTSGGRNWWRGPPFPASSAAP